MRNVCLAAALLGLVLAGTAPARAQKAGVQVQPASGAPVLRMPTRGGSIIVKVLDYERARQRLLDAALRQGAELMDSKTSVDELGKKVGWIKLRLPSDRLPQLLPEVRALGKLYSEDIQTSDRVSEYEELERRVGRLREHEQRLGTLLQSGSRRLRGSDILYIQERLFRAGVDEGQMLQRRSDLERASRVSAVTVELFEPEPRRTINVGSWYAGASLRARTDLYRILAKATTAGAYVLFFAPFWVPALIILIFLVRWIWRLGRRFFAAVRASFLRFKAWIAAHRTVVGPPAPPPPASISAA